MATLVHGHFLENVTHQEETCLGLYSSDILVMGLVEKNVIASLYTGTLQAASLRTLLMVIQAWISSKLLIRGK